MACDHRTLRADVSVNDENCASIMYYDTRQWHLDDWLASLRCFLDNEE
jgi:hypothetical protein